MQRKILILTSERTGGGHKASSNALQKKFESLGYNVKQIDCFELMGKTGKKMEDCYIPLTTRYPLLWKISHDLSNVFPAVLHNYIYLKCKNKLLKEILDFNPDIIISVHCMFTMAVSKLLRKNKLNIPFAITVIDLINPPVIWRDKNADLIFLPTDEVLQQYTKLKFDTSKLIVSGFPIREDILHPTEAKQIPENVNILMLNPSIKLKNNRILAREVGSIQNVNLTIVCGLDHRMYNQLIKDQKSGLIEKNIKILPHVNNINELMQKSHILLSKAGPNAILEGTRSGTAVVVTGHIPGQESKNYLYITENKYGIKCENPKKIKATLTDFITSGNINDCLKNVLTSKYNDGVKIITGKIDSYLNKGRK